MKSVHPHKVAEAQSRLFRDALHQRGFILAIFFVSVLSGLVILAQMYSLSILIDAAFLQEWIPNAMQPWILILVAAILVRALLVWIRTWLGMRLAVVLKTEYRKKILRKLHRLGPVRLRQEKTGDLISLQLNGVERLDDFFAQYVPAAIQVATIPVVIFGFVMWVDWPTGLVFLITGPLIPIFMYLIGTKAGDKIHEQWNSLRRMNAHFLDTIQGMDTLKLFGREKYAGRSINNVSRLFRVTTMRVLKIAFLSGMVLELAASVSTAVVAVEVGVRLIEGMMIFQTGMFVLLLAPEFYLPFRTFGAAHHAGMEGAESGAQLFDLLDRKEHSVQANASKKLPSPPFTIELKKVEYSYPLTEEIVLNGVNLQLNPGEIHTLTGASGEGKTTLLHLLSKFIEPDSGSVLVNGRLLENFPPDLWRNQITYVPQFPHLFSKSVAENIKIGDPDAPLFEVAEAARAAHAFDFIQNMPDGFNTMLGENGMNLSGGERQRIALARSFLKQSPILLLDEPAASLNTELEEKIMESLKEFSRGRIIMMVSHRTHSVLASDRLSVIKNGVIVESGEPDRLLPDLKDELIFDPERLL